MKTARGLLAGLVILSLSSVVVGEGKRFALAGKSIDDHNFIAAWQACDAAAKKAGDSCIHVGNKGASQFRAQDIAIMESLALGVDGLAVSVTSSKWLSGHSLLEAKLQSIPLVTFDSDLENRQQELRASYIGPDNQDIGRALGQLVMQLKPKGGRIWLMSGSPHDTNLNERISGVRKILSGDPGFPAGRPLNGEAGWTERPRSPWYCWDDLETARMQTRDAIADTDVFLSVGSWPVAEPDELRSLLTKSHAAVPSTRNAVIVMGIGNVQDAHRQLLRDQLVQGFVALDFSAMGAAAYSALSQLANGGKVAPVIRTGARVYITGNEP